jgi:hypothetical protein
VRPARVWSEAVRKLSLAIEGLIGERLKKLLGGH